MDQAVDLVRERMIWMEQFSCCSLHLECSAEGRCVVERGLMALEKAEMEQACSLAKRLKLLIEDRQFVSALKKENQQLTLF